MTIVYRCDSCKSITETDAYRVSEDMGEGSWKNWHLCATCFYKLNLPEVKPE